MSLTHEQARALIIEREQAQAKAEGEQLEWERAELVRLRELSEHQSLIIDKLVAKPKWDRAQDVEATSAMNTLLRMGYTYTGAGEWIMLTFDPAEPGGDMTATAVFIRDGEKLTLMGIEHSEPAKLCAASVGGLHCQSMRSPESLFCTHHRSVKSRMFLTRTTSEELEFLMRRDGEQQ